MKAGDAVEWLIGTFVGRTVILLVALGIVLGAVSVFRGDTSSPQPCGILANGQKLCGSDLSSYCRGYARGSLDQQTVQACALAGVDVNR